MVVQLSYYAKNRCVIHLRKMNFTACEFYLHNLLLQKEEL